MPSDHKFKIGGLHWLWRYTRLRGSADGWSYLPDAKNPRVGRKILIDSRLTNRRRLEVEIHEALHASFPQIAEEEIEQAGVDMSRILWALGYRIKED